jgi:hypothetical protein
MKQLVVLLLLVGTAVAEEPHSVATHEMYNNCRIAVKVFNGNSSINSSTDPIMGGYCMGYVRGVADGLTAASNSITINGDATIEALVRSFVNYLNAHPGEIDSPNILSVLEKAWRADNILSIKPVKQ